MHIAYHVRVLIHALLYIRSLSVRTEQNKKYTVVSDRCTVLTDQLVDSAYGKSIEWKVAVFQHRAIYQSYDNVTLPKSSAAKLVDKNVNVYRRQAKTAAGKGAKLIVFPEYGLYPLTSTRKALTPYLEDIPTPNGTFCPCNEATNKGKYIIQYGLSCIAKRNKIYVVATAADRKICTGKWKPSCPSDGQWLFNTAVAYNADGCLVARYHKQWLYGEKVMNTPPETELSTFWTPYGKFGLGICFDILFKNPMVDLVEKESVDVVAFPTAWMDALPFLPALGFHSGWAWGMNKYLLASNRQLPTIRMHGSGIYGPQGSLAYTYNSSVESERLVIATLPPRRTVSPVVRIPINHEAVKQPESTFNTIIIKDNYKFTRLEKKTGLTKVCNNKLCCYLRYEMEKYLPNEFYGLGVSSGSHRSSGINGTYYLEVCILVRCTGSTDSPSCWYPLMATKTKFKMFYLDGNFKAANVFPVIFSTNMTLPETGQVQFGRRRDYPFVQSTKGQFKTIGSVALVGRRYDKDVMNGKTSTPTK